MNQSLGLLEVAGLLPAISVADAMAKTANVQIIAVEEAKGNGWMTVKIEGSVDAVNAAIDAGVVIAKEMNVLISKKVIARPDKAICKMFGSVKEEGNAKHESSPDADVSVQDVEKDALENVQTVELQSEIAPDQEVSETNVIIAEEVKEADVPLAETTEDVIPEVNVAFAEEPYEEVTDHVTEETIFAEDSVADSPMDELGITCNLCMDPLCTRKKGEFKTSCLHYIK